MALFGEKYGDEVRDGRGRGRLARALRRHARAARPPRSGSSRSSSEGSSAANVRRIEAVTGPEAIKLLRAHDAALARDRRAAADAVPRTRAAGASRRRSSAHGELERELRRAAPGKLDELARGAGRARRPSATA